MKNLVKINFVQPGGETETYELELGISVMQGAMQNGVAGIDADCGGACSCATCHVKIAPEWIAVVGPPSEMEADMLEAAPERDARSRLSCQIELSAALDGLVVEIPSTQR